MPREFKTRDGVKLEISAVPSMVVLAMQKTLVKPEVPTWRNEEKQRTEENPNDPAYVRALEEYNTDLGQKTTDAYLANGVRVIDLADSGKAPLESEEWSEGLEYLGIVIPANGIGRRIAWLRYHIIGDSDLQDIVTNIALAGGVVSEEQVAAAVDSFRPDEERDTDTEVPNITELRQRDKAVSDTRAGD